MGSREHSELQWVGGYPTVRQEPLDERIRMTRGGVIRARGIDDGMHQHALRFGRATPTPNRTDQIAFGCEFHDPPGEDSQAVRRAQRREPCADLLRQAVPVHLPMGLHMPQETAPLDVG